jgi:hypothetical protein
MTAKRKTKLTPKQSVLMEFPSAWFNAKARTIEAYSESLVLGHGSVLAPNIEKSAWADAARWIKEKK